MNENEIKTEEQIEDEKLKEAVFEIKNPVVGYLLCGLIIVIIIATLILGFVTGGAGESTTTITIYLDENTSITFEDTKEVVYKEKSLFFLDDMGREHRYTGIDFDISND